MLFIFLFAEQRVVGWAQPPTSELSSQEQLLLVLLQYKIHNHTSAVVT